MLSVRLNAAAVAADDLNECQITRLIEIKVNRRRRCRKRGSRSDDVTPARHSTARLPPIVTAALVQRC